MKILFIGDPHFKRDNGNETTLMTDQISDILKINKPNIIIILGDLCHYHEKTYTGQQHRTFKFIENIHTYMPLGSILIILIGNHDRINNKVYMTDEHIFNPYKKWGNTYIIDTITPIDYKYDNKFFKILAIPYIEVGRFAESLMDKGYAQFSQKLKDIYGTKNFKMIENLNEITYNLNDINLVVCHQEFLKCKMNSILSTEGDYYPLDLPMCVSGHIHDEDQLQTNLFYPGTPIQHSYGDTKDKALSMYIYDENFKIAAHKRISLNIPKKLQFVMTPSELLSFIPPENSIIKIKLKGHTQELNDIMKLDYVKKLQESGVVIVKCETLQHLPLMCEKEAKTHISYQKRLYDVMEKQNPDLQSIFNNIIKN
jgi:predicted phosphodiesterase